MKILNFRGSLNLTPFYRDSIENPQFGSQKSKLSKDNFRGEFTPPSSVRHVLTPPPSRSPIRGASKGLLVVQFGWHPCAICDGSPWHLDRAEPKGTNQMGPTEPICSFSLIFAFPRNRRRFSEETGGKVTENRSKPHKIAGISFPKFVERSILKLPFPSSVLCPLLYRTEHFSRGEKGEKGAEKPGRKRGDQQRGEKGRVKTGQGFCKKLQFAAVFCEILRFPAVFCENLLPRNSAIPRKG